MKKLIIPVILVLMAFFMVYKGIPYYGYVIIAALIAYSIDDEKK